MASGIHFKAKGKWKDVNFSGLDLSVFDDESFSGLVSMEELTDYDIVKDGSNKKSEKKNIKKSKDTIVTPAKKIKTLKQKSEHKANKAENLEENIPLTVGKRKRNCDESADEPKRKKKRKKSKKRPLKEKEIDVSESKSDKASDADVVETNPGTDKKSIVANSSSKKFAEINRSDKTDSMEFNEITENDLPGWKGMFVPSPVLKSLSELGFSAPTPIQALTLPSAIRDKKDIVGAAETGSGKTLSFGIPLIHHILERKNRLKSKTIDPVYHEEDEELSDLEIEDVSENPGSDLGITDTSENEEFPPEVESDMEEDDSDIDEGHDEGEFDVDDDENCDVNIDDAEEVDRPLYGLILTPTRELAIQVRDHIHRVAKYTDISVIPVVGGISLDKQRRLLKRRPEIVVATPGRLWELMQEGNPHLSLVPRVPFLVIDECDRMVEKGHFDELSNILELMNNEENSKIRRQVFVFSATLTFVHDAPNRFKKKKKLKKLTIDDKVKSLMSQIGIKEKPKIVDLTKKMGTAETLTETKIHCSSPDKDLYLYYFLQQFPGRTLIFTNSKDCLRRLQSILTLLQCNPLPLHADMHQKQRLKNLERFSKAPKGLLLATDVAARGLDIPDVQHVIHFQVPITTENYIHRSGRTARAFKEGLSFMIIGPDDIKNYRKILRALKRTEDIPQLPVDLKYLPALRERLDLAKAIDADEHKKAKAHHHNNWFVKAAKEMDIELDDDLLKDTGDSMENSAYRNRIQGLRNELKSLLKGHVVSQNASRKYPTMTGKLVVPYMATDLAIDKVKNSTKDNLPHKTASNKAKRRKHRKKNP